MESKIKGLVLKLIDYKDADKLAWIFSYERGIISAKFTGVRREKAKMKPYAQPFVFADFTLVSIKDKNTITSADMIDNFPLILADYNKTMSAYLVLDLINSVIPKEKEEKDIFLLTISALKNIEIGDEYVALIDYILKFISFSGLGVQFPSQNKVLLDKDTGNFTTESTPYTTQIDMNVYRTLKAINDTFLSIHDEAEAGGGNLSFLEKQNELFLNPNFKEKTLKQAVKMLHNIIFAKFNVDIRSFSFI